MPVCHVIVSDKCPIENQEIKTEIRKIIANALDSKSRRLDESHIALRIQAGERSCMLADVEIEVFAQNYYRRLYSRDKRAKEIATKVSELMHADCAAWINLCQVGYARHTMDGEDHFSIKADDKIVLEKRKRTNIQKN